MPILISPVCWQCDKHKQQHEGKISKSGKVFTCYNCLRNFHNKQVPIWKKQDEEQEKLRPKVRFGQMSLFDAVDTLNSVF